MLPIRTKVIFFRCANGLSMAPIGNLGPKRSLGNEADRCGEHHTVGDIPQQITPLAGDTLASQPCILRRKKRPAWADRHACRWLGDAPRSGPPPAAKCSHLSQCRVRLGIPLSAKAKDAAAYPTEPAHQHVLSEQRCHARQSMTNIINSSWTDHEPGRKLPNSTPVKRQSAKQLSQLFLTRNMNPARDCMTKPSARSVETTALHCRRLNGSLRATRTREATV